MKNKFIIIFGLIITFVLFVLCFINENNLLFNRYGAAIVMTDSMAPEILKNDVIVIKRKKKYQVNDVVVYKKNNELIVHRIIDIEDGLITTKGDANDISDQPIKKSDIYGKVIFNIQKIGIVVTFFNSKFVLIGLIVLIIILFVRNCKKEMDLISSKRKE